MFLANADNVVIRPRVGNKDPAGPTAWDMNNKLYDDSSDSEISNTKDVHFSFVILVLWCLKSTSLINPVAVSFLVRNKIKDLYHGILQTWAR